MSTQDSKFAAIPFSLSEPLQNVRLLEVPEELLDIIVNTQQNLYFKSAAPASHLKNGVDGKEGNLHLCTDDKVWAVKQVSTSNSIHVTKTCSSERVITDEEDRDHDATMELDELEGDASLERGISAIAKPTSILELHALHQSTYETVVQEHLENLVPTISSVEEITIVKRSNNYNLQDLYDHIPAPTSVIQRVLAQKCVFEAAQSNSQPSSGVISKHQTYMPSPILLLSAWTEIVNTAILDGKDITNLESIYKNNDDDSEMLNGTDTPDDDHVKHIHNAISTRLFQEAGHLASLGIMPQDSTSNPKLNPRECTRWVGNLILAAAAAQTTDNPTGSTQNTQSTSLLTKPAFEKDWEDRVPTDWIKYCSVEVLQPSCEVTTVDEQEVVKWLPFTLEGKNPNNESNGIIPGKSGSQPSGSAAAPATKNKRKWHEKFAAQRDAKK